MMKHTSGKMIYSHSTIPTNPMKRLLCIYDDGLKSFPSCPTDAFCCCCCCTNRCLGLFPRMGPWMGDASGSIVHDKPKIREMYHNNKHKMDKYPYLYAGFNTIEEFRPYYCPMEILDTGFFLDCDDVPSIDNGTLAGRFEKFVRSYSGLDPFDIQLRIYILIIVCYT